MSYSSTPLPLEFWTRLQNRMQVEYEAQLARLADALKPVPVTVDTGEVALQRAEQTRGEVFALVRELENMQLLFMILGGQVRTATYRASIPDAETHIACLRNIASLFETSLCGQPRRFPLEQELKATLSQYGALRTAGTGEVAMQERQRLRSVTINLPVLGAEDTTEHERALRTLHANIDQQEAELQNLKVTTRMSLRVPDELAALVASFSVTMTQDPEPAPAPAGDVPALPSANA